MLDMTTCTAHAINHGRIIYMCVCEREDCYKDCRYFYLIAAIILLGVGGVKKGENPSPECNHGGAVVSARLTSRVSCKQIPRPPSLPDLSVKVKTAKKVLLDPPHVHGEPDRCVFISTLKNCDSIVIWI